MSRHPNSSDLSAVMLLLDAFPDTVLIVDSVFRIVGINGQASEILQYSESDPTGVPVSKLIPDRFQERFTTLLNHSLHDLDRQDQRIASEMPVLREDGSALTAEIGLNPVPC